MTCDTSVPLAVTLSFFLATSLPGETLKWEEVVELRFSFHGDNKQNTLGMDASGAVHSDFYVRGDEIFVTDKLVVKVFDRKGELLRWFPQYTYPITEEKLLLWNASRLILKNGHLFVRDFITNIGSAVVEFEPNGRFVNRYIFKSDGTQTSLLLEASDFDLAQGLLLLDDWRLRCGIYDPKAERPCYKTSGEEPGGLCDYLVYKGYTLRFLLNTDNLFVFDANRDAVPVPRMPFKYGSNLDMRSKVCDSYVYATSRGEADKFTTGIWKLLWDGAQSPTLRSVGNNHESRLEESLPPSPENQTVRTHSLKAIPKHIEANTESAHMDMSASPKKEPEPLPQPDLKQKGSACANPDDTRCGMLPLVFLQRL